MGLGHALEVAQQKVVQPLPLPSLVDHHLAHGRLAYNRGRHVCVPIGISGWKGEKQVLDFPGF
jgi:hypothetical protein